MTVPIQEATTELFARYGRVVKAPTGTPTAQGPTFRFWSDIAAYLIKGETEIGLCTVVQSDPATVSGVERHLHTPEILIPVDAPFVLPVMKEDGDGWLEAFEVGVGEAVVIDQGVWHGACLPVGKVESTYFVIFRRGTPHDDVEKKDVAPATITF